MDYNNSILVVDISSNSCSTYIFNLKGDILGHNKTDIKTLNPQKNWYEVEPDSLWEIVCNSIKNIKKKLPENNEIIGMSVTGQLGLVAIGEKGEPLTNILTWMDKRAYKETQNIKNILGKDFIYRTTGRRVNAELSAPKIIWLKNNNTKYKSIYKFLTLKDFIIWKLTDEYLIDHTHASYSMLYNIDKEDWDEEILKSLNIKKNKLPIIYDSHKIAGKLTEKASKNTSLKTGLPVVLGGPDGSVGTVGVGMIGSGLAVNVVGTTDVFFACCEKPIFDNKKRTIINRHIIPDTWSIGGPMSTTGGCLNWFKNQLGIIEEVIADRINGTVYDILDKEAASIKPSEDDPIFFTSLVGERTPYWNSYFKGSLVGLKAEHKRENIIRAILEGSSFPIKKVINILESLGIRIEGVNMIGGGARSDIWPQIRSNITNKKFFIPLVEEASAYGAFIISCIALNVFKSYQEATSKLIEIKKEYHPEKKKIEFYNKRYEKYRKAHKKLEELYQEW